LSLNGYPDIGRKPFLSSLGRSNLIFVSYFKIGFYRFFSLSFSGSIPPSFHHLDVFLLFFWLDPKEPKGQDAAKLPPALPTRPPLLRQPPALVSSLLLGGCLVISLAYTSLKIEL